VVDLAEMDSAVPEVVDLAEMDSAVRVKEALVA